MFNIGNRIRELRKISNMTSTELANKMEVNQSFISRLENNSKKCSMDNLFKLCDTFNITLSDFFNEESNAIVLTDELKSLVENSKTLSTSQINALITVVEAFKET